MSFRRYSIFNYLDGKSNNGPDLGRSYLGNLRSPSTKNRARWLTPDVEEQVWRYLGGICRAHKFTAVQIGGVEDHVHMLPGCRGREGLADAR